MSPGDISQQMRKTNRIFEDEVVGKGDFSALDRVYTKGARVLPPGAEMITGAQNIRSFWQQAAAALDVTSVKLQTVEMEALGDTVIEIGRGDLGLAGSDSPTTVKYVVVWKKEDGSWKWDVDIWNPVS